MLHYLKLVARSYCPLKFRSHGFLHRGIRSSLHGPTGMAAMDESLFLQRLVERWIDRTMGEQALSPATIIRNKTG